MAGPAACKFGAKCTRAGCTFAHDSSESAAQPAVEFKDIASTDNLANAEAAPARSCKFGLKCHRVGCHFAHPAGFAAPGVNSADGNSSDKLSANIDIVDKTSSGATPTPGAKDFKEGKPAVAPDQRSSQEGTLRDWLASSIKLSDDTAGSIAFVLSKEAGAECPEDVALLDEATLESLGIKLIPRRKITSFFSEPSLSASGATQSSSAGNTMSSISSHDEEEADADQGARFAEVVAAMRANAPVQRWQMKKKGMRLGSGSFGKVYEAMLSHPEGHFQHVKCAVKFFDGADLQDLLHEVAMMKRCQHDHIVKCLAYVVHKGKPGIVMEHCAGTLESLIRKRADDKHVKLLGWFDMERVVKHMWQLSSALAFLHCELEEPVAHRDISCDNIMYHAEGVGMDAGVLLLGDLGMARASQTNAQSAIDVKMAGKDGYMAPELVDPHSKAARLRCDIFAIGRVLFALLTGKEPRNANVTSYDIDGPADVPGGTPDSETLFRALSMLYQQCTAVDSHSRPSARELFDRLSSGTVSSIAGTTPMSALAQAQSLPSVPSSEFSVLIEYDGSGASSTAPTGGSFETTKSASGYVDSKLVIAGLSTSEPVHENPLAVPGGFLEEVFRGFVSVEQWDRLGLHETERFLRSDLETVLPPIPIVYSPDYSISFFGFEKLHSYDLERARNVVNNLKLMMTYGSEALDESLLIKPTVPIPDADLDHIHSPQYLKNLRKKSEITRLTEFKSISMIPFAQVEARLLTPFRRMCTGSVLAARIALQLGVGVNLGGGFHQCSRDQGEVFSVYADITLIIWFLRTHVFGSKKIAIVDLDALPGNGHARDKAALENSSDVLILDVYNRDAFPRDEDAKAQIDLDCPLESGSNDDVYLRAVASGLRRLHDQSLARWDQLPDFVIYNAGTNILANDPVGRLGVSQNGVRDRDRMVFEACRNGRWFQMDHATAESHLVNVRVPICMLLSGGYEISNAGVVADSLYGLHIDHPEYGLLGPPRREGVCSVHRSRRYGGNGGSAFEVGYQDDYGKISVIEVWSGCEIDRIGFQYENGRHFSFGRGGAHHAKIDLDRDEIIRGVNLRYNYVQQYNATLVSEIEFVTQKRKLGPFGGQRDPGPRVCISFPENYSMIAVFGRSGAMLDQIGFVARR